MNFDEFIEKDVYYFYGVDGNYFKLGDIVWKAIEDPSDGWRSYLDSIEVKADDDLIFFRNPIALLIGKYERDDDFQGYRFREPLDDHIWLEIGTMNYDDWYPNFAFHYNPKRDKRF